MNLFIILDTNVIFILLFILKIKVTAKSNDDNIKEYALEDIAVKLNDFLFPVILLSYELLNCTVIEPIANNTVVALATTRDGVNTSYHRRFPEVNASHIPTATIVPHEAVLSANVTAVELVKTPLAAVVQFVLLFVKATLAYAPPEGSVNEEPDMSGEVVLRAK